MSDKQTKPIEADKIELRADGWERFESAVDAALQTRPKHRTKPKPSIVKEAGKR